MGTATNQIATYADCNSLSGTSYNAPDTAKCPTKLDITSAYPELAIGGSYTEPQCVKYSHLSLNLATPGDLYCSRTTFSPLAYSYTLTIQIGSDTTRVRFLTDDWISDDIKVTMNNQTLSSTGYIDVTSSTTTAFTCTITCEDKNYFEMEVTPYNETKAGNSVTLVFRAE